MNRRQTFRSTDRDARLRPVLTTLSGGEARISRIAVHLREGGRWRQLRHFRIARPLLPNDFLDLRQGVARVLVGRVDGGLTADEHRHDNRCFHDPLMCLADDLMRREIFAEGFVGPVIWEREPRRFGGQLGEAGFGYVRLAAGDDVFADQQHVAVSAFNVGFELLHVIEAKRTDKAAKAKAKATNLTFDACCDAYIASHRAGWRNVKHQKQWTSTLKAYASPIIGKIMVRDVDIELITQVIEPLWATRRYAPATSTGLFISQQCQRRKYLFAQSEQFYYRHVDAIVVEFGLNEAPAH